MSKPEATIQKPQHIMDKQNQATQTPPTTRLISDDLKVIRIPLHIK